MDKNRKRHLYCTQAHKFTYFYNNKRMVLKLTRGSLWGGGGGFTMYLQLVKTRVFDFAENFKMTSLCQIPICISELNENFTTAA